MYDIYSDYRAVFDQCIGISDDITEMYMLLCEAEVIYGSKSNEYKKIEVSIKKCVEQENKLLNDILSDSSITSLFKKYIIEKDCRRLKNRLFNDWIISKAIFDAEANDNFDNLFEKDAVYESRTEFLNREFEYYGKDKIMFNIFNLMLSKQIALVLDQYIDETDDLEKKRGLIYLKNRYISESRLLETWYFGFDQNLNTNALLVDCDYYCSEALNVSLDKYQKAKKNFFLSRVEKYTNELYFGELKSDVRTALEISMIASLLCMDINDIDLSHAKFSENYCESKNEKISLDDVDYYKSLLDTYDYIDGIYGKSLKMAKKLKKNYPDVENV